jgi:ankyrin repeat protein
MGLIPSYKFIYPLMIIFIFLACNRSPAGNNEETGNAEEVSGNVEAKAASNPAAEEEMRQAALDGDGENVNKLLEAGTQVNAMDQDGHTALMFAAFNGHSEIVLALLEGGAGVDRRDLMGRTALLYASTGPFPETVKILLDKGAKPNIIDSDEHFTPIMHAAAEGNLDVVKILLEYEADLSLTDVDGDDAESFARQAGHIQVAEYLQSVR